MQHGCSWVEVLSANKSYKCNGEEEKEARTQKQADVTLMLKKRVMHFHHMVYDYQLIIRVIVDNELRLLLLNILVHYSIKTPSNLWSVWYLWYLPWNKEILRQLWIQPNISCKMRTFTGNISLWNTFACKAGSKQQTESNIWYPSPPLI